MSAAVTNWFRIIALAAAIIVITLQAGLLVAGHFYPRAAANYRATYIDRSMDCWRPAGTPAYRPSQDLIVPRDLSYSQACALLPKGWNDRDATNVWSNGATAEIDLPLRPADAKIALRLLNYSQVLPQAVEIIQPGKTPFWVDIPVAGTATVNLTVPHRTALLLTLKIAHVHQPLDRDVMDWRAIGIALLDIRRSTAGSYE